MEQTVQQLGQKFDLWQPKKKLLVAVSTGVDSMVLLRILEHLQQKLAFTLGVAHVNHRLREQSEEEALFLANYCQEHQLAFHYRVWEEPAKSGIEAAARQFRYTFFADTMAAQGYDTLITAHHGDDQIETMLMKMIREGNWHSSIGIRAQQAFAGGQLVRLLLTFSKEELVAYAAKHHVTYFEDASNQELKQQRNRLRHQVVPLLKAENPRVLEHFQQLSQQLLLLENWLAQEQEAWFMKQVTCYETTWLFDLQPFLQLTATQKELYLNHFFLEAQKQFKLAVSEKQLQQLLELLVIGQTQWQFSLGGAWRFERQYHQVMLLKKQTPVPTKEILLQLDEGQFLSETEWLGVFSSQKKIAVPEKIAHWQTFKQKVLNDFPQQVLVRKRQKGDRIQLTPTLTKKVSRLFIDRKIPNNQREKTWVIQNEHQEVLFVLPIASSYLSIALETDKIHYILLYKYWK